MDPIVGTKQGPTEGLSEGGIFKFLGVPYAQPPVSELRWRPPVPAAQWAGVRKAQDFGPICPQTAGAVFKTRAKSQSEDCLYLNVWTRSLDTQARQPVMVWIHGGGYLGGGGCEDGTDGSHLAALGVTVVSFGNPRCFGREYNRPFCDSHHIGRSPVQAHYPTGWRFKGRGHDYRDVGSRDSRDAR